MIIHCVGTNVGRWEEFGGSLKMLHLFNAMAESWEKYKTLFNPRKEWSFSLLTQQQLEYQRWNPQKE